MARELIHSIEKHMGGPIVWGVSDCCTGPCGVFNDIFGLDPMIGVRGAYSTAFAAARIINPFGGLLGYANHLATASGLHVSKGIQGDIGVSKKDTAIGIGGRCLMICVGEGVWAAKTENGVAFIKGKAEISWRV